MRSHSLVVSLALGITACGGVDMPPDEPDALPAIPDAAGPAGPAVVSVTPVDGAVGVAADATITIVFSAPMNTPSVEAAWMSAELPAPAVAFVWNPAHDALAVEPDALLSLATGTGLDPTQVAAKQYTFGLTATATDASGVALAAPLAVTFSTRKRMSVDLAPLSSLSLTMRSDGLVLSELNMNREIGDTSTNLDYKTFASFAVPVFPAGALIESARLVAHQSGSVGSPYTLGALTVDHVNTPTIDASAFTAAPLATLGSLATDENVEDKRLVVTAAVVDDLDNHTARGDRTQYRLAFPTATDGDNISDYTIFLRDSFALSVTYLAD